MLFTFLQERLLELGDWLGVNGEAIYSSRMWREHNETTPHGVGKGVYYTASSAHPKPKHVFAILLDWPVDSLLTLTVPRTTPNTTVTMLGWGKPLSFKPLKRVGVEEEGDGMVVILPSINPSDSLGLLQGPWVLRLEGIE